MSCGDGTGLECIKVTCPNPACGSTYCTVCSACACSLEAELKDE
jgi:hypothetical protein